ncbi:septum formation initiator family protein [Caloranaerobacter sp. TR13]|uniref:FtsB family cell division protein n=1 Tax=Caloranaerobacter sp. TR13 TaxID=1302151 RepID=UPI0006D3C9FE|nr:septum formation initiator family protein [Caloranaerobacter sp. TR13]
MRKTKQKRRFRLRYILLLACLFYLSTIFFNQQKMMRDLEQEKKAKEDKINSLNVEIAELQDKIRYADTPEFIEKIAREELNMLKPGEIIYIDKEKNKNKFIKGIGN